MFGAATIIASNYLAFARVLAASFRRFHPGAPFWVLVIDDPDGLWVTADEDFTVLHLGDVGFDGETIHRLAAIYDVLELATAVKPWLLQHLLATTGRPVVYLDPDIEVFSPLDQLAVAAGEHGVAVTPHLLEPLPLDGLYPDDAHMLRSGVHNLGFLAVGPQVLGTSFLPYWQGRTEWMAIVDIQNQLFTDQRWMDWIDCFDHVVIRERGCNVAYWNAWARPITRSGDGWLAGGEPLRFFHFSGFDPANPWILSRHQVDRPRVRLSEHPELAELCRRYASAILAAGHEETSRAPYGWARCGRMELTGPIRRLYRRELMAAVSEHRPGPAGPFEGDGEEFVAWLRSPGGSPRRGARGLTPVGPPVPRLVMAEHERRPDLGAAFPNPTGPTAQAFLEWAAHDEGFRRSTPPELVAALRDGLPSPPELRPGVNIAGYLSAELGVGSVGRLVVEAARAAGLPFATYDHHDTLSRRRHGAGPLPGEHDWRYDVNVLCANADSTRGLVGELGQQAADKGRATVAMWHWEAERLPAPVRDAWDVVDEVWVTSRFAFDALVHDATKPLRIFPLPVVTTDWTTSLRRADLGLPDGFLVLFCFDWLSVEERKNPVGLIQAYSRAFAPGDGAHLVIKTINGDRRGAQLEKLRLLADRPDITVLDGYLDWLETRALMELADCYASLHRSEGFGLTLAEAMALGKPVVATGWSGNIDFMDASVAHLVPAELVPIPDTVPVYGGTGRWADPDLDAAARALRSVFDDAGEATALGRRARSHIQSTRSLAAAGTFLAGHVERLRAAA